MTKNLSFNPDSLSIDDDISPLEPHVPTATLPQQRSSPDGSGSRRLLAFVIILALVAIAGTGIGVYAWQHAKLEAANTALLASNHSLAVANEKVSALTAANDKQTMITETLDNGQTINYPLTSETANVMWWSQDYYSVQASEVKPSGNMVLSDKLIPRFLSTIASEDLEKICQEQMTANFTDIDIQMNVLVPSTKSLGHNQYENCFDAVVNSSTKYAAAAKIVATQVQDDITAFTSSLTLVK